MPERLALSPKPDSIAGATRPITWSDSVAIGPLVWLTGQVGRDEETRQLIRGDSPEATFEAQTERALENIANALKRAGSSLEEVILTRTYLTKHENYVRLDKIFERYFPKDPPARVVLVMRDSFDLADPTFVRHGTRVQVMIECVAVRKD